MNVLKPKSGNPVGQTSGGAAAGGGFQYQAQVTAWWATRILLQTPEVGQRFDLPATAVAVRLSCETGDHVDDIRIELSEGSLLLGQCKRSLQKSKRPNSEFGKVFLQFINETAKTVSSPNELRYVLFYERYSGPLDRLGKILDRYRGLAEGSALDEAAVTQDDRKTIADLNVLLDALVASLDLHRIDNLREILLRRTYIMRLAVSPGKADYDGMIDSLRNALLVQPDQVHLVMKSLHELGDELIETHGSKDRAALRTRLHGLGVDLQDSIDFRKDFLRLDRWSQDRIATEEKYGRDRLSIGGQQLTIDRPILDPMRQPAMHDSFLVVGEAGCGKTGCLLGLTSQLRAAGRRVWYCIANPTITSLEQIHNEVSLELGWQELLEDARTGIQTTLITPAAETFGMTLESSADELRQG